MSDREIVVALEAALGQRVDDADIGALLDRATERGLAEAEEAIARLVRRRALSAALAELDAEPIDSQPIGAPAVPRSAAGHPSGAPRSQGAPGQNSHDQASHVADQVLVAHAVVDGTVEPAADAVEAVDAGGLTVVASWADAEDLDEARWTDAPDRELIERMVSRHDDIVREACSTGRAVPLRFGGVFRSPGSVRRWLEENRAELTAGIELVGGCWEWTVRGAADPHALETLADIAVADLPNGEGRLDASYLVRDLDEDRFTAAVETFRAAGADLELSGPWPPYSFADATAVPTDRAG